MSEFRTHYEKRKAEVLNHTPQIWEYRKRLAVDQSESPISVFTTWELAAKDNEGNGDFSHEEEANMTRVLLESVAFFDCTSVPEDLPRLLWTRVLKEPSCKTRLIRAGMWDSSLYQDLLAELLANSLIASLSFERETVSFSLHPLVRDWACLRLTEDKREKHVAAATEALCLSYRDPKNLSTSSITGRKKLASHFDASFENSERFLKHGARLGEGPLVNQALLFASFYNTQGDHEKAELLLSRAFATQCIWYGKDSLFTIGVQMDLANVLQIRSKWEQAEECYRHSLMQCRFFLGPDHLETLNATERLAWGFVWAAEQNVQEAIDLLSEVLKARESVYGLDHGATLKTMVLLAWIYREKSDSIGAEPLYLRCIGVGAWVINPSVVQTTIGDPIIGLALVYRYQCRVTESTALFHHAYTEYRKHLSSSHPICLEIALEFSMNLVSEGEYESAVYLTQIVKERSTQLGEDRRMIARSKDILEYVTTMQERFVCEVKGTLEHGSSGGHTSTCRYRPTDKEPDLGRNPAPLSNALQRLEQSICHIADDILYGIDGASSSNLDAFVSQPRETITRSADLSIGIRPQLSGTCTCLKEARSVWPWKDEQQQQGSLTKFFKSLNSDLGRALETLYHECGISSAWTDVSGQSYLHRAAWDGHTDDVQAILASTGVDVNIFDIDGDSALMLAIIRGYHEIVESLLNHPDTNVNARADGVQKACLHVAARYRQTAIMLRLLEHKDVHVDVKDCYGRTPFWIACGEGLGEIVSMMLDRSLVDYNFPTKKGRTPLMIASQSGHEAVVKSLLKQKCIKVNAKDDWGQTALIYGAWGGNNNIVRALIDAGVDVTEVDEFDETIMFNAISRHKNKTVHLLVSMPDVPPDIPNFRGITPLARAAARGNNDAVQMLIKTGNIDLDFRDNEGHEPLYKALQHGHAKVVEMLLEAGADPNIIIKDSESYTWANSKRHKEQGLIALQMIKDAQAERFRSGDINDFGLTDLFALTDQDVAGDIDQKEVEAGAPEVASSLKEQTSPIQEWNS